MSTPRAVMTAETLAFVEPALPEPCGRVLEVGCGEGDLARRLAAGGRTVVGLDTSARAVAKARAQGVDAREVDWTFLRPGGRVIIEDFAFAEVDAPTAEWIRSLLKILQATGRLTAPDDTQAFRLLEDGPALELWFSDHHHIHPAPAMDAALGRHTRILSRAEAPYLYRYLEPCLAPTASDAGVLRQLFEAELRAIVFGAVKPLGRRWVAEKPVE